MQNTLRNDTFIIIMGDHGHRGHTVMRTRQGVLEMRMPLMYLILPEWFREQHPVAWDNLNVNKKRLATPLDLHATIMNLLNFRGVDFKEGPARDEVTGEA
jgi:hypothetical protein